MTTYNQLIDIIIQKKDKNDISTRTLSKMVGCSYVTMCNYLSGRSYMPADILLASLISVGCKLEVK